MVWQAGDDIWNTRRKTDSFGIYKAVLVAEKYDGFISIEMGKQDDVKIIEDKLQYVRGVFQ